MSIEGDTSNLRAPAERDVYSNAEFPQTPSPNCFESRFIGAERHVEMV